jgi:hypothetical protein
MTDRPSSYLHLSIRRPNGTHLVDATGVARDELPAEVDVTPFLDADFEEAAPGEVSRAEVAVREAWSAAAAVLRRHGML